MAEHKEKEHKTEHKEKPEHKPEQFQMRKIVRFLSTDIDGETLLVKALRRINGIRFMTAHAVLQATGVDGKKKVGEMPEGEIKRIEEFVKNLGKGSKELPSWLLNRRKDVDTGKDLHAYGNDLDFKKMEDINTMKKMRSSKGVRHELGQPV